MVKFVKAWQGIPGRRCKRQGDKFQALDVREGQVVAVLARLEPGFCAWAWGLGRVGMRPTSGKSFRPGKSPSSLALSSAGIGRKSAIAPRAEG